MRTAVYPGTFDPITLGHEDVIARAARLADRLVVGVTTNAAKSPMFTVEERVAMVRAAAAGIGGAIEVVPFDVLIVDFARSVGAGMVVRGLRSATDLDYEMTMAGLNGQMAPEVETVFLTARPALQPLNARLVREIALYGGTIAPFLSVAVAAAVEARAAEMRGGPR